MSWLSSPRLRDIPVDVLVERHLGGLLERPDHAFYPTALARSLDRAATEAGRRAEACAWADAAAALAPVDAQTIEATAAFASGGPEGPFRAAWSAELVRGLGDAPYRGGCPTRGLPGAGAHVLTLLAVLDGRRDVPLAAAVPAPPDALTVGDGPVDVVIAGDPLDKALPDALVAADALLAGRAVRWVWLHAPEPESPSNVIRSIQIHGLLAGKALGSARMLGHVLRAHGRPMIPATPRLPDHPVTAVVRAHLALLDACGVPRSRRPAMSVGRTLLLGPPGPALVAAVDAAATA